MHLNSSQSIHICKVSDEDQGGEDEEGEGEEDQGLLKMFGGYSAGSSGATQPACDR